VPDLLSALEVRVLGKRIHSRFGDAWHGGKGKKKIGFSSFSRKRITSSSAVVSLGLSEKRRSSLPTFAWGRERGGKALIFLDAEREKESRLAPRSPKGAAPPREG